MRTFRSDEEFWRWWHAQMKNPVLIDREGKQWPVGVWIFFRNVVVLWRSCR